MKKKPNVPAFQKNGYQLTVTFLIQACSYVKGVD